VYDATGGCSSVNLLKSLVPVVSAKNRGYAKTTPDFPSRANVFTDPEKIAMKDYRNGEDHMAAIYTNPDIGSSVPTDFKHFLAKQLPVFSGLPV
jgi:hypothetical protein